MWLARGEDPSVRTILLSGNNFEYPDDEDEVTERVYDVPEELDAGTEEARPKRDAAASPDAGVVASAQAPAP